MKQLAVVGISNKSGSDGAAEALFGEVSACAMEWINAKGNLLRQEKDLQILDVGKGREAAVESIQYSVGAGRSQKIVIREPMLNAPGFFQTTIHHARHGNQVDVVCVLEVDIPSVVLSPINPLVSLPKVIHEIVSLPANWEVAGFPISALPKEFFGDAGGKKLAAILEDSARTLPMIVVSLHVGREAVPRIAGFLSRDLCGLANVAVVDDDASWQLTQSLGRTYSCHSGAIRLYWPLAPGSELHSISHPRWRKDEVVRLHKDTRGGGIREQLKTRIFHTSTFRPHFSSVIKKLKADRDEATQRQAVASAGDDKELAVIYSKQCDELKQEVEALTSKVSELELRVAQERENCAGLAASLKEHEQVETPGGKAVRVKEVAEAVELARTRFSDALIFGADVGRGVTSVAPTAGPPVKIFNSLERLAELSRILAKSTLKDSSTLSWLKNQGIACSGESETVRKSAAEMKKRTWDSDGKRAAFEDHIKVKEATDPGNCVRIYFDWLKPKKKIVVAWVGRHP